MKFSYISIPAVKIHTFSAAATSLTASSPPSPRKASSAKKQAVSKLWRSLLSAKLWLSLIALCMLASMLRFSILPYPLDDIRCSPVQTQTSGSFQALSRTKLSAAGLEIKASETSYGQADQKQGLTQVEVDGSFWAMSESKVSAGLENKASETSYGQASTAEFSRSFPIQTRSNSSDEDEQMFWKQPDSHGYMPCIEFSDSYRQVSSRTLMQKRRFLLVTVNGGLNQQRSQIIDAVILARIFEATLVIPILEVNFVWGDESEFSDIFDVDHFKQTLKDDVHIVSSLPSTHIKRRPIEGFDIPYEASPQWFRSRFLRRLNREGVLLLRALDSKLSKDLPADLQKLRCKVAFEALRFSAPILKLGEELGRRMSGKGPYVALHLRLEKDVWVRTGCSSGLGQEYDEQVVRERQMKPQMLTARSNMTYEERKSAGLCPLNAAEVARLLKALGASADTKIYWAGGEPLGGKLALHPLLQEFPHLYNKDALALPGELDPFTKKASAMAAIDYLICLNSDVFMPSHGGNMGRALRGHRAFNGHWKYITPNKREMMYYFSNPTEFSGSDLSRIMRDLHNASFGQPTSRMEKKGRDVVAFPLPECMCQNPKRNPLNNPIKSLSKGVGAV